MMNLKKMFDVTGQVTLPTRQPGSYFTHAFLKIDGDRTFGVSMLIVTKPLNSTSEYRANLLNLYRRARRISADVSYPNTANYQKIGPISPSMFHSLGVHDRYYDEVDVALD